VCFDTIDLRDDVHARQAAVHHIRIARQPASILERLVKLDVNGTITPNPTADHIAQTIKARPTSGDWSIVLENDAGDYLQGYAESGHHFRLTCRKKGQQFDGKELVGDVGLNNILVSYLANDKDWRRAFAWDRAPRDQDVFALLSAAFRELKQRRAGKAFKGMPGELSPLTILGAVAIIGLFIGMAFALPHWKGPLSHLPWPFSTYEGQLLLLFALVPVGITLLVAREKLGRIRQAASWQSAPGKVIESQISDSIPDSTIRNELFENMPRVRYAFAADGRNFVGERISFGDDTGGANTQATLARYPVGREVTVYFNPGDPEDCVLEREAPKGLLGGCLGIAAFAIVAVAIIVAAAGAAPGWIAAHFPKARNPNLATLTGLMGLAALLIGFAVWRRISRAGNWPAVPGVVTFRGIEEVFDSVGTSGSASRASSFRTNIEYAYTVDANTYTGRQIRLGVATSGSKASAQAVADRYPVGAPVEVHYDPGNPADAAIERSTSTPLLPLLVALALTAFALYQAGVY